MGNDCDPVLLQYIAAPADQSLLVHSMNRNHVVTVVVAPDINETEEETEKSVLLFT